MVGLSMCDCETVATTTDVSHCPNKIDKTSLKEKRSLTKKANKLLLFVDSHTS
jgi:hypothetical protein